MDIFRMEQKRMSRDGSPKRGRHRPYGCACCRKIPALAAHKRHSRALARARLRSRLARALKES